MNSTIDTILILANPAIIIVQCFIFSWLLRQKDKMIEQSFQHRYEMFKEHLEYRMLIERKKMNNEKNI